MGYSYHYRYKDHIHLLTDRHRDFYQYPPLPGLQYPAHQTGAGHGADGDRPKGNRAGPEQHPRHLRVRHCRGGAGAGDHLLAGGQDHPVLRLHL